MIRFRFVGDVGIARRIPARLREDLAGSKPAFLQALEGADVTFCNLELPFCNPETVPLAATGPGLFTLEGNRAAVLNSDFTLNSPAMPADRGSVIMAFLTGVGEIDPALQTGHRKEVLAHASRN